MNIPMQQYSSQDLFEIETEPDGVHARKVLCRLCGEVVFDRDNQKAESADLAALGVKVHYEIRHQIMIGAAACTDRNCMEHGP